MTGRFYRAPVLTSDRLPELRGPKGGDRPLRVALVVEAAGGGVGVHVADLIDGLAKVGVEIHLIVPASNRFDAQIVTQRTIDRCASFARVPMDRSVSLRDTCAFAHLFRHLTRISPDIVHSHSSKAGVLARACRGPWRHVYTPHALYTLNPHLTRVQRLFYGTIEHIFGKWLTDRLIAVSIDEARHARHVLKLPLGLTTVIHNGVPDFPRLPRAVARKELGLAPDGFTVGFVGRFTFQKGLDRLMAASDLLAQRYEDAIEIAVIGSGDLAEVAGRPRDAYPPNLRPLGEIVDARRYFNAFDLFALTSRYEGFPYVYLEAMAAGLPIVTTRVSGADELVAAERIGIVVANDDTAEAIADAIGALHEDHQALERLSANCGRAIEHFSAARMVRRTLNIYHETVFGGC
ncbi:glycosyltransferase family 1 protein [Burkholderia stagnalis]|uniref:Glycosyltransferase family 1 protein n=2 Tax=Burkholderia stagnalis TaxID=1503054 RepID=A0ABX9YDF3_9BURK|nr:glycosyltransferase family 1 protein [Burkholderia stagnalis]RQQ59053.1 glycosyltransferase family 1 protein [Burkholderia stagnalis]RQQ59584.1 glycosyltransferase family 1 protein [Burkholderia stagnalis]RQQ73886.1 glycosyltransferase family 1 protein [Burkholderia stagnalis]RQQ79673.1 glycosyltransferase family 1 protein [Burkholderia stagnalis]